MRTSKSALFFTGTSRRRALQGTPPDHPNRRMITSSFTGTSRRGDLAEAFRKAKQSLQAARQAARAGIAKFGEVAVTVSVPVRLGIQGTPPPHPPRRMITSSFTGTSRRGDLAEAFTKAKRSLQAARAAIAKSGDVSVMISVPLRLGIQGTPPPHPPK